MEINPSTIPGLILRLRSGQAPGVCSGLILSGAAYPDLKIGVCRRRSIKRIRGGGRNERSPVEREFKRLAIEQQEDMVRMDLYHLHSIKDVPLRGDHAIDHGKTLRR